MEQPRKQVRSRRVREILDGLGRTTLASYIADREFGFPQPIVRRGRRWWFEDEVVAWRDRRDRAEIAAGMVLQNRPELVGLLTIEQHAHCVDELLKLAETARRVGPPNAAILWESLATDLRAVGPNVMVAAEGLAR